MLLEAPGALEWEAAVASKEDLAAASGAEVEGRGLESGVGVEAVELAEARPRVRSGSLSLSWAAWSRT